MTPSGVLVPGALVRVTVASGSRRVDLALPGAVPVAELVPELARSVGLLTPATAGMGHRLVTAAGRRLEPDVGLLAQGVGDGGLLTIVSGLSEIDDGLSVRVYDDVAEAMADAVELELRPWDPTANRPIALGVAVLLLGLGALALLGLRVAWLTPAALAILAATGAVALSRVAHQTLPAVVVAWLAAAYAAVAGALVAGAAPSPGQPGAGPVAAAGLGAAAVGLGCLLGLERGRPLMIPAVVDGALLLACGLVAQTLRVDLSSVLLAALTAVVLGAGAFPRLALTLARAPAGAHAAVPDPPEGSSRVTGEHARGDARLAHDILVALSLTVGVLLLVVAPVAVARGALATGVVLLCSLVPLLRVRLHRNALEVLVGLVAGVAGVVLTAVSALWLHPDWRPVLGPALVGAGAVALTLTVGGPRRSVRRGRLADLVESVVLLGLPPVLVLATGWLPWVPAMLR